MYEMNKYYEDLIHGRRRAHTGIEKYIEELTLKDAGKVLAIIGIDHPASQTVFTYFANQNYQHLFRHPVLRPKCIKLEKDNVDSSCERVDFGYQSSKEDIKNALKKMKNYSSSSN